MSDIRNIYRARSSACRAGSKAKCATLLVMSAMLAYGGGAIAQTIRPGYNRDVIYQVFVDRFFDGNAANNIAADPLFDATGANLQKYVGGDFQGLTSKVTYLKNMGVSAIWITSPAQ